MLDPAHPITAFFDDDPERVLASLPAIEQSSGEVKDFDTLYRKAGERELRGHRDGIFDAKLLGDARFGHIETVGVVHPSVYPKLVEIMGVDTPYVEAIARGEKLWRDGKTIDDIYASEEGDLTGPRGIAEMVRRANPTHPLLALCTITKIPVPPIAARPLRPSKEPEAVDAWIGPVNEAWLELLRLARQDVQLQEIGAPPIILDNTSGRLQAALDTVYQRTRRADGWLVPPMIWTNDGSMVAIAYAGPERIVIQRGTGVRVVDTSGTQIHTVSPSGPILRGTVDNRYALFHDFQRDTHPFSNEEGYWHPNIHERMSRAVGPISVLDVHTGQYLDRAPANLPRTFVENDEPEDLLLGGRKLDEVGGDRPVAAAYTNDLRFAEISGDSSQIISLTSGLTLVRPATMYPDEVAQSLDLETGEIVEHDWDDQGGGGACAITFADGKWFTFDHYGVLADHLGNDAICIVPAASAAAFDPAGKHLALVIADELVIIDRVTRAIVARFPA